MVIDHGRVIAPGTPLELKQRYAGDVLDVTVERRRGPRASGVSALDGLGTEHPTVDRGTNRVSVPVSDGVETLTVAVRRLDDAGVSLDDLALRRPSLDDVFLALTGHATGNGTSDDEPEENER